MSLKLDDYNWREDILHAVYKRMEQLEKVICNKEKCLQQQREGKLRIQKKGNGYQYFIRTDPKDTNGKYIPLSKRNLAVRIAQQDYDEKLVSAAKKELRVVSDYAKMLENSSITSIYEMLHLGKRILVNPIFLPDNRYVESWRKEKYEPLHFLDGAQEFYSDNGIRVRSKSELLIANALERTKIPYRYEFPVKLKDGRWVRPDFLCLNVRTRKEFIWEHFGMMDNIAYANENVDKIVAYEQSGFFAGKNMIMTFETSQHAINTKIIKCKIDEYLL